MHFITFLPSFNPLPSTRILLLSSSFGIPSSPPCHLTCSFGAFPPGANLSFNLQKISAFLVWCLPHFYLGLFFIFPKLCIISQIFPFFRFAWTSSSVLPRPSLSPTLPLPLQIRPVGLPSRDTLTSPPSAYCPKSRAGRFGTTPPSIPESTARHCPLTLSPPSNAKLHGRYPFTEIIKVEI